MTQVTIPGPTVPPGTPVHTRWGWVTAYVLVAAAVLTAAQLWAMSGFMQAYLRQLTFLLTTMRTRPGTAAPSPMIEMYSSMMPMTIAFTLIGLLNWGLLALGVVAAYRDHEELGRLGYPKRFHWAWSFLNPVYPIGRAVVVHRQAGAGWATLWVAIAATAATFLISIGWSMWLLITMFDAIASMSRMAI
ncbi:hypothetical protein [Microbacterium capsulatum]|uniref:DUF4328 domain-containing protein n=1 Tax=Microbacterium capsulatum TaxID=3041921 RepID=A0ABU0XB43_9MICO|nr:hypothetical protein [Microbacterium sp. ASV81]MDQ4212326.1 hypothetical protein [Microbacterium sp. ASV81]